MKLWICVVLVLALHASEGRSTWKFTKQHLLDLMTPHVAGKHAAGNNVRRGAHKPGNFHKRTVPCTELTKTDVALSSPGHPGNYADDLDVCWHINAPGEMIHLWMTFFDVEQGSSSCPYDWVTVNEGIDDTGPPLGNGRHCGATPPGLLSAFEDMYVKFHTDGSVTMPGFAAVLSYGTAPNAADMIDPSCTLLATPTAIMSINHPRDYNNNIDTCWVLEVADTQMVTLTFTAFAIEEHPACVWDSVRLHDGPNKRSPPVTPRKLCGTVIPRPQTSTGKYMTVHFITDGSVVKGGFSATFSGTTGSVVPGAGAGAGTTTCGVPAIAPRTRIVGGDDATPHSWPWQISLRLNGYSHICGGSILSENWVITAAHCVDFAPAQDFRVAVGEHRLSVPDNVDNVDPIHVAEIIIHENWEPNLIRNDIALLRLSTPIAFNANVSTICIPQQQAPAGLPCYTTGWGWVEGSTSGDNDILQQVVLPILSHGECTNLPDYGGVQHSNVCAGGTQGESACKGDSGGPLVCQVNPTSPVWTLHGLTSWGFVPCAQNGKPTVYTRVTDFVDWIREYMGSDIPVV